MIRRYRARQGRRTITTDEGPADQGGETPCFAHLLDQPTVVDDSLLIGLVRDLADGVVIADADGSIVFWNDAADTLLRRPGERLPFGVAAVLRDDTER